MGDRLYAEVQLRRPVRLLSLRADMDKEMGMESITLDLKDLQDLKVELNSLQKFKDLVYFIANDYHELSYEKAVWQRDDWKKRCWKLIQEEDDGGETVPGHPHV